MDGRVATFLEQESMFWSKNLWDKAGHVLVQYKTAGDYHLWKEFAKYEALYTLDSVISGFRIHAGQKSGDRNKYYAEVGENSLCGKLLQKSKLIKVLCCIESFTFSKYRIKHEIFSVINMKIIKNLEICNSWETFCQMLARLVGYIISTIR